MDSSQWSQELIILNEVLNSHTLPETKISEGFHIFAFWEATSLNTFIMTAHNTPKKKRAYDLIFSIRKLAKLSQFSTEVNVWAK